MSADITLDSSRAPLREQFFVTLEDEYGMVNVVVWSHVALRRRKPLLSARLMAVRGRWEHVDGLHQHLIANDLHDLSHLLGDL